MIPTTNQKSPAWYTTEQFAETLQVSPNTIRPMIKRGEINAMRLGGARGIYRIPATEINRLAETENR